MKTGTLKNIIIFMMTASTTSIFAKSAPYMIPPGNYLDEKVVVEASKVQYSRDAQGYVVALRYRMPFELDGKKARTLELTHEAGTPDGVLAGSSAAAECYVQNTELKCVVEYDKTGADPSDPDGRIFPLNVDAADKYIAGQNLSSARVAQLKAAQMSIMHEAIGILTLP